MGFLGMSNGMKSGIGQGLNQASQNVMQLYMFRKQQEQQAQQQAIQQQQMAQQKAMQDAQIQEILAQAEQRRMQMSQDASLRSEMSGLFQPQAAPGLMSQGATEIGPGELSLNPALNSPGASVPMVPGQPTAEQMFGVLGKYDPKSALSAMVSMSNTDERVRSNEKIQSTKNDAMREALASKLENAIGLLNAKNDAASALQARKLEGMLEQLKTKADLGMGGTRQKPPTGYRETPDGSLEPVPGGPADIKFQNDSAKAVAKVDELTAGMDMMATQADSLIKHPGLARITGIMGKIPNVPGSDAANAQALLDSLKSQTGLSTLASLKSGTGAGLGQVTEAEHRLLQNYITALETAQSPAAMKTALNNLINWTSKAKGRIQKAFETSAYGKKGGQSAPAAPSTQSTPRFTIKSVK